MDIPQVEDSRKQYLIDATPTMNLKPVLKLSSPPLFSKAHRTIPSLSLRPKFSSFHTSFPNNATVLPFVAFGPPPPPPVPAIREQKTRRKLQAALTENRQNLRNDLAQPTTPAKPGDKLMKRFWKDVIVKTDSGMPLQQVLRYHQLDLSTGKRNTKNLESSRRRNPWNLSRRAPRPQPQHQKTPSDPLLQAPPCNGNSP